MGLTFLVPLFLAGLVALAIPILIHLTHRERRDAVPFPSLMFLRRVPYRTVRRQRIRHWLLFLLRSAAIALVVAAFARPLLDSASLGPAALGSAREVVILFDRSYSMSYGDRWSRALDAARRAVDEVQRDDRATLIFFSDRADAANHRTPDRPALHAALNDASLDAGRTQYGPALQLARDIIEASNLPRREVVLITDFQRVGWENQSDLRLPEGTTLTWVDLSDAEASNVAVTGVLLDRSHAAGRNRVTVSARVVNTGDSPVSDLSVSLEIGDQELERQTVDLPARASSMVRFATLAVPDRVTRGRVSMGPDALPEDDAFRFVLAPVQPIPALIVQNPGARAAAEAFYLQQALRIGRNPPFDLTVRRVSQLRPEDFDGQAMVVLNDARYPPAAAGRRLGQFVNEGGGLLVVLGQRAGPGAWPATPDVPLPAPGMVMDRLSDRGGTVSILDYSHPVFEQFSAPRSGDFSAARFFRYRRYDSPPTAHVLARFDDGAVALMELRVENGRAMVWTSGLANLWNDLPLQPVFLPFIHEVIRYLADYRERPAWYTAGQVVDLAEALASRPWGPSAARAQQGVELVIDPPSGSRFVAKLDGEQQYLALREHGFYVLRPRDGNAEAATVVGVNPDYAESDLSPLDPEELVSAVTPRDAAPDRAAALAAALTPAEKERRQGFWWYLLVAVLLILLAETAVAGRLSQATR